MTVVQKSYSLKLSSTDAVSDKGTFSGTALIYGEADSVGDRIREGCFAKSISDASGRFPCLWNHSAAEVLGTITVEADQRSLAVKGHLLTAEIPKAREIHALLKARAIKGLSVGFLPIRAAPVEGAGTEFIEGRLLEISLCALPAYASAAVHEVRSLTDLVRSLDERHDREALLLLRKSIDEILGAESPDLTPALVEALGNLDLNRWRR